MQTLALKIGAQRASRESADRYFEGTQPLSFLAPEVQSQVGNRLRSLNINWARKIVEAVLQRLTTEGFGLGHGGTADASLWDIWQDNDLDEWSQMAYLDALVHGRSFMSVWGRDDDPSRPQIMTETAYQMAVDYDPGTRRPRAALKVWADGTRQ